MTPRHGSGQAPRRGSGQAPPWIREAGDSALLLQLEAVIDPEVNARVIGIADAVRAQAIRGVRDVVSTYRSVAVHFDPLVADADVVRAALERASREPAVTRQGRTVDVPVTYDGEYGPDLDDVAAFAGITRQEVIERHSGVSYRVFMLGFLPGFPYMGTVPAEIAMPRRATPRVRVAAGSVGIAGAQTGIYPRESPGGWQIIGRTPLELFDPDRNPPARFAPGDAVRFVHDATSVRLKPDTTSHGKEVAHGEEVAPHGEEVASGFSRTMPTRCITVLRPGLFTTIQDRGRWGHQAIGVPVGGAMDLVAHRVANALVGNGPDAATLEATLVGPELRLEHDATLAAAGADLSLTVDGHSVPFHRAIRGRAGSVIRFGNRRSGARTYLAFDGGIAVPPVLGSRATHVRSGMGGLMGRALAAGDRLTLGAAREGRGAPAAGAPGPAPSGGAVVRVLPGPQEEFFAGEALTLLQRTRFVVSSQSDRMGYRLEGGRVPRLSDAEMISDATVAGAIQVPPSGEPVLLMADRQTTGGYPQMATVITADLPLVAQLAPGDWIEFQLCSRAEALAPLVAQEGTLRALG